jgi:hypothetical protein
MGGMGSSHVQSGGHGAKAGGSMMLESNHGSR